MTTVRLWAFWPMPDGELLEPGEEVTMAAADAAAICAAGAGEIIGEELAVVTVPEQAVGRRQRKGRR